MTSSLVSRLKFEQDLDPFEERLTAFVKTASPQQLIVLVNRATVYLERVAEKAANGPGSESLRYEGWTYFNNATSAINHAVIELAHRI